MKPFSLFASVHASVCTILHMHTEFVWVFLHKVVRESRLGHIVITRCIKITVCYGSQGEWWRLKWPTVVSFSGHYSMWQQTYRMQLRQRATWRRRERVYTFAWLLANISISHIYPFILRRPSKSSLENSKTQMHLICINIIILNLTKKQFPII